MRDLRRMGKDSPNPVALIIAFLCHKILATALNLQEMGPEFALKQSSFWARQAGPSQRRHKPGSSLGPLEALLPCGCSKAVATPLAGAGERWGRPLEIFEYIVPVT